MVRPKGTICALVVGLLCRHIAAQNDVNVIGTTLPSSTTTTSQDVSAASAGSATTTSTPAVITVSVNKDANKFTPDSVTAKVGDIVKFEFWPTNNSVARSEFLYPCIPYAYTGAGKQGLGFYSGFMPIAASPGQGAVDTSNLPAYYITINRVTPLFFYNAAPDACAKHQMVGVINPANASQLPLQREAAAAATLALAPGEPLPAGSAAATAFDTATATSTSTSASSSSGLGRGAIAGVVIGVLAGVLLLAGAAVLCLRRRRARHGHSGGDDAGGWEGKNGGGGGGRPFSDAPTLTSLGTLPRSPVVSELDAASPAVSELPGIDGVMMLRSPGGGGVVSPLSRGGSGAGGSGSGGGNVGQGRGSVFEPWSGAEPRMYALQVPVANELSAYGAGEVRKDQIPSTPPAKRLPDLPTNPGKEDREGPYELG